MYLWSKLESALYLFKCVDFVVIAEPKCHLGCAV